jgi:diguanylate cyclase (GGDEF)-like protein
MRSLHEALSRQALQDTLTGLPNRAALIRHLGQSLGACAHDGTGLAVLFIDLDGFKQVNDTFGHAAGDAVLAHFADTLLAQTRDSDVVSRLGGDEFGVLLAHASVEQGRKKADILAEKLKAQPTMWQGKPIPIGFSYGAFELKGDDTPDLAMARADEAMYAQKKNGR